MADRTRLAAAGLFLALTLAALPALLPIDLAGAGPGQHAEAAAQGPATRATPAIAAQQDPVRSTHSAPAVTSRAASESATVVPPLVHLRGVDLPRIAPEHAALTDSVLQFAIDEAAARPHTVASGETLWKISHDAGIGVEALAVANHLTLGAVLRRGQVLIVPPVDPTSPKTSAQTHEVAPGETLWGISHASGVSVETLAAANNLSLDVVLHPGQVLVVPLASGSGLVAQARQTRGRRAAAPAAAELLASIQTEPLAGASGPLGQPSDGLITSRFGWRIHPIFGTREFHTGLDIANRIGTPVRAAESGIVRFVGWMGGYGRLITVTHANGLETSYSHLSAMLVMLGQRVVRGQVLGHMGNTGWSTGPHLLFEVRRNGVALDPVPFLHGARGQETVAAAPPARSTRRATTVAPAATDTPAAATPAAARPAAAPVTPATAVPATPATATSVTRSEEHRTVTESPLPNLAPIP
jgi:murein DD-endopeptidase MepM/ murein hydrolase activator NlpD